MGASVSVRVTVVINTGRKIRSKLFKVAAFKASSKRLSGRLDLIIAVLEEVQAVASEAPSGLDQNITVEKALGILEDVINDANKFSVKITKASDEKLMFDLAEIESEFKSIGKQIDEARGDLTAVLQITQIKENQALFGNLTKTVDNAIESLAKKQQEDKEDIRADIAVINKKVESIAEDMEFLRKMFSPSSDIDNADVDIIVKATLIVVQMGLIRMQYVVTNEVIQDFADVDAIPAKTRRNLCRAGNVDRIKILLRAIKNATSTRFAFDTLLESTMRENLAAYDLLMKTVGKQTQDFIEQQE